jgi:hypothetical protein
MRQYQLLHKRGKYTYAKHVRSDDEASIYGGDYERDTDTDVDDDDELWSARTTGLGNAPRLKDRADVSTETGRSRPDVQTLADERLVRNPRSSSLHSIPARATQTNMPAVKTTPTRRRLIEELEDEPMLARDRRTEAIARFRVHWLVFVGLAMIVMVVGWILLTMFANWWQVTQDNWRYGFPRTYQVDEVVGHNDSASNPSHFIAINLNAKVEVIEFPGGDSSKAKVYIGPTLIGPNADLAPVTLTFEDVNGDGKLDMIVNVQGSHLVFINDGGQFRPAKPSDHVQTSGL